MPKKEKAKVVPAIVAKAETLPVVPEKKKTDMEIAIANLDSFGSLDEPEQTNRVVNGSKAIELKSAAHLQHLFADQIDKLKNPPGYKFAHGRYDDDRIDLNKAEHVVINDTIFILLGNSVLNIRDQSECWDRFTLSWIGENDVSAAGKSLIILNRSKVEIRWASAAKGKSIISRSTVNINGTIYLNSSEIKDFHLSSEHVSLHDTELSRGNISAKNITIKASTLSNISMSAKNAIHMEDFMHSSRSTGNVRVSGTPHQVETITIKPNHSLYGADFAIPQYCRNRDVKFDINVCSRLDYGRFSATGTLKFVRCNADDLLVGGVFIDSQKFEQVASRLRGELGEPERGNYPHYVPTLVPYLDNARLTNEDYKEISGLIWELAIGDYLRDKEYVPDRNNKVQNTLILGLIDQISARINLYKQINFLVS